MKTRYINKSLKDKVKNRFGGKCGYCGLQHEKLQVDHINAFSYFKSTNDETNLMPACAQCNNMKMSLNLEQFRYTLQDMVNKARKYSVNFRFAEKYGQIITNEHPIQFYFEIIKEDCVCAEINARNCPVCQNLNEITKD